MAHEQFRVTASVSHLPSLTAPRHLDVCVRPSQTWDRHVAWVDNFTDYLQGGKCLSDPTVNIRRPATSKPARLIWCTAPLLHSPVWRETIKAMPCLTTNRHYRFGRYAQSAMEAMGVTIVDMWSASQSRWEDVHDGVHYLPEGQVYHGNTVSIMAEIVANTVFPTCSS